MTALPRAIPKHGDVKGRWLGHQRQSRITVMLRCRGSCEAGECQEEAREWAHAFGRRHIVSEPWCSSPELTFGLCKTHHQAIDRGLDPDLLARLRWVAVARFARKHGLSIPSTEDHDELGAIRALVDAVEERG